MAKIEKAFHRIIPHQLSTEIIIPIIDYLCKDLKASSESHQNQLLVALFQPPNWNPDLVVLVPRLAVTVSPEHEF